MKRLAALVLVSLLSFVVGSIGPDLYREIRATSLRGTGREVSAENFSFASFVNSDGSFDVDGARAKLTDILVGKSSGAVKSFFYKIPERDFASGSAAFGYFIGTMNGAGDLTKVEIIEKNTSLSFGARSWTVKISYDNQSIVTGIALDWRRATL